MKSAYFEMDEWKQFLKSITLIDCTKLDERGSEITAVLHTFKHCFNQMSGEQLDCYFKNLEKLLPADERCGIVCFEDSYTAFLDSYKEYAGFEFFQRVNELMSQFTFEKLFACLDDCIDKMLEVSASGGSMHDYTEFIEGLRIFFLDIFETCSKYEIRCRSAVEEHWRCLDLRIPDRDADWHVDFNLFVSVGMADWHTRKYPVVSATYLNGDYKQPLYQDRKIGWAFSCNPDSVIYMSKGDCCTAAVKCCNFVEGAVGRDQQRIDFMFAAAIAENSFEHYIAQPQSLSLVYPLLDQESLIASEELNEVVLRGDTKPDGVFVDVTTEPITITEANTVVALSIARNIPVILYDGHWKGIKTVSSSNCAEHFYDTVALLTGGQ